MDTSIYYDIRKCKSDMLFEIIIGPRGCGKTYSVLDYEQELSRKETRTMEKIKTANFTAKDELQ